MCTERVQCPGQMGEILVKYSTRYTSTHFIFIASAYRSTTYSHEELPEQIVLTEVCVDAH